MQSLRLTQLAIDRMNPPQTGRLEIRDLVVPGLQLRVSYSGLKSYSLVARYRDKTIRVSCGRHGVVTLAKARDVARKALADIDQGIDPRKERREARAPSDAIEDIVEDFIRLYRGRREKPITERTKQENARVLRDRFVPHFEGRSITTIKRIELIEFVESLVDETPALAHKAQIVLSTFFSWATDREVLDVSPAVRLQAAHKPKSRNRVLTDDEIKILWPAFQAQGNPFGPFYQMCLLTAARRAEVATMRWQDIDSGVWKLSNTKTGVPRDIPLSTTAQDILSGIPRQGEYVFTFSGHNPISGFSKAKKLVEADIDNWTTHDLRRTTATHMAKLKTSRIVVMAVLGHVDSSVTSIYDHHDYLEEKTHALQQWADKIARLTGDKPDNVESLAEVRAKA